MMTLRNAMTCLFGIGSLVAAATSCAAASLPPGAPLRDRSGAYEVEVLVDGVPAPTYAHDGETYVMGQLGARYTLRVHNHSGRRVEAVVSVDGRDVIDGKPAELRNKRGYLVPAYGQVDIDGWRISRAQAAAFRFSTVPESYAARTGNAREVGVIGVAVFPERYVPPPPPPIARRPLPFYPQYPQYDYDAAPRDGVDDLSSGVGGAGRSSPEAESRSAEPPRSPAAAPPPAARSMADRGWRGRLRRPHARKEERARAVAVGPGHRIRRGGAFADLRGRVRARQRRASGGDPRPALQRPRRADRHGHRRRRSRLGVAARGRAAPHRRSLPGRRPPLRRAPAGMAPVLLLAVAWRRCAGTNRMRI